MIREGGPKHFRHFDPLLETGSHGRSLSRGISMTNEILEDYQTGKRTLGRFKWEEA